MAGIFGILGLSDTERVFANTVGQAVVYDGITRLVSQYNDELYAALAVFVEEQTPNFKERYKLPGGGRLQRRGGLAPSAAVKAYGGYDVAYPLEDFGAQLADSDVAMAYMTLQDIDRHLDTIFIQDANTVRFELLKALLNNTQDTFVDPLHGSLSIEPLANGDAVVYPPVLGSETEATATHYLSAGYAATAISDTNNPYITVRDELEEHFGATQGGANIAAGIPLKYSRYSREEVLRQDPDVILLIADPALTGRETVISPFSTSALVPFGSIMSTSRSILPATTVALVTDRTESVLIFPFSTFRDPTDQVFLTSILPFSTDTDPMLCAP
jgi:hypothetical protein